MSHFSVAVISKTPEDIDKLLAPFDEQLEVKPYLVKTKKDAIKEGRLKVKDNLKYNKEYFLSHPKDIAVKAIIGELSTYRTWSNEDFYNYFINSTFWDSKEELIEKELIKNNGDIYDTYNNNSKWDWYVIGGRYSGLLRLKKDIGYGVDQALVKDVNFNYVDKDELADSKRYWDIIVEGHTPTKDEKERMEYGIMPSKEYLIENYSNKFNYLKEVFDFKTYAILTPDEAWHKPGQVLYFGMSSASEEDHKDFSENYFNILDVEKYKDHYITIVDCHI